MDRQLKKAYWNLRSQQREIVKGVDKKNSHLNFSFAYISSSIQQIFKIFVPTPHNTPLIMWGTHNNFKDLVYRS